MSEYKMIKEAANGELIEKKSRFIGSVYPVKDESEANAILEKIKKKYWDAKHNCYAYVIGSNGEISRCSDDGEPSGTAGRPILAVINGLEIRNVLVVVTRYFGGVLLGTGGLIRAYTECTQLAFDAAQIVTLCRGISYELVFDYNFLNPIKKCLAEYEIRITDTVYEDKVHILCAFPMGDDALNESILQALADITGGKTLAVKKGECEYEK